ncbi:MAG: M56 family metallopeptidase [Flammeovirgaceae bacterium]
MKFLESIFNSTVLEAFGLTLMHSLWQGAVFALLLAFALFILRKSSSKARYYVASGSLVGLFLTTMVTFCVIYQARQVVETSQLTQDFTYTLLFLGNPDVALKSTQEQSLWAFIGEMSLYFQTHAPLILSAWLMGVLVLTLRLAGGYTLAQRLKSYKTREVEAYWTKKLDTLMEKVGIQKSVRLLESGIAKVPMVIGHLKPVILVPAGMLSGLTPHQVEAVLAHELAHIKRNDYLINLIQSVLEVILFYHPATWWISACIREERENACDDIAIQVCGDSLTFARALSSLEQRTLGAPQLAMAFYGKKGALINRIRRLIGKPNHRRSLPEGIVLLSLICLTFFSFAFQVDDKNPELKEKEALQATTNTVAGYEYANYQYASQDTTKKKNKDGKVKADKKKNKDKNKAKDKNKDKGKDKIIIADDGRYPLMLNLEDLNRDSSLPYVIQLENLNIPNIVMDSIPIVLPDKSIAPFVWTIDSTNSFFIPKFEDKAIWIPDVSTDFNFSPKLLVPSTPLDTDFGIILDELKSYPYIIKGKVKKGKGKAFMTDVTGDGLFMTDLWNPEAYAFNFAYVDTTKTDSTSRKAYQQAREEYKQALAKIRAQRDSQRVELEKYRKEYFQKQQEELKKYREAVAQQQKEMMKQREKMMDARKKEMEKLRDLHQEQAERQRAEAMELRKVIAERAEAQKVFWDHIREQLVKDGLLEEKDDPLKLSLDDDEMKVNGQKVSDQLHQKYKKLFSEQFGEVNYQWKGYRDKVIIDLK